MSYATVKRADGTSQIVSNTIKDAGGGDSVVSNEVLQSDGVTTDTVFAATQPVNPVTVINFRLSDTLNRVFKL